MIKRLLDKAKLEKRLAYIESVERQRLDWESKFTGMVLRFDPTQKILSKSPADRDVYYKDRPDGITSEEGLAAWYDLVSRKWKPRKQSFLLKKLMKFV